MEIFQLAGDISTYHLFQEVSWQGPYNLRACNLTFAETHHRSSRVSLGHLSKSEKQVQLSVSAIRNVDY